MTKFRRLRWAGYVARMEKGKSAFKILTSTPTGKKPLGRPNIETPGFVSEFNMKYRRVGFDLILCAILEENLFKCFFNYR